MDLHSNSHPESGKLEQIVSQFLLKSLHIVLDSRIPSLHPHDRSADFQSSSRVRKSDKWFNLVLGDRPATLGNLNFWQRNLMDPMIIDIILVRTGTASSSVENLYASPAERMPIETVIERWVVQYKFLRAMAPQLGENSSSYKKTYKKSIILLRSLYSQTRLLPAYRIFRQLSSSSQTYDFDIIYKVSSFCEPFIRSEEEKMKEYSFVPVEALPGHLSISVTFRPSLSDFNLEPLATFPPKIITDYVGSPTTDPLRSFPSSEKGVRATSFPLRGICPPNSTACQRPHSWTSGFHRASPFMLNQPLVGSPPAYRTSPMPYDFPSPPLDTYGHRVQSYRPQTHQKATAYDDYQLSPPFSPSMSPSTPTYFPNSNPVQTHITSETAPVTIPLPMTSRSSRYVSPNFSDPNKNSLPPLSPRSTRYDPSSQESSFGIRSIKKAEITRAGESNSGVANHYSGHKTLKDSKDDSGRFSGLLSSSGSPRIGFSRSSSRLSFQDELDDGDFSCPFDVDDVDISDSPISSHNLDGKRNTESTPHSLLIGKKSQDAAVGVLVHMLRTAPPLRQDPSCYSTHSFRTDLDEGVATASGFFLPRKTADALEELRSYREMKDLLLSKSGTRMVNKEEA
ncbi:autophagy-related protein 13a isoform X1 [Ricinus communis]|uniref:autophagy-related protein 13a isoform X1 n=1 Tax=Ricinus communis TaxID=3988 RepID=UPI00201A3078|nr:autophagy-related protein 13a isoform X1 [Ricinus communis]